LVYILERATTWVTFGVLNNRVESWKKVVLFIGLFERGDDENKLTVLDVLKYIFHKENLLFCSILHPTIGAFTIITEFFCWIWFCKWLIPVKETVYRLTRSLIIGFRNWVCSQLRKGYYTSLVVGVGGGWILILVDISGLIISHFCISLIVQRNQSLRFFCFGFGRFITSQWLIIVVMVYIICNEENDNNLFIYNRILRLILNGVFT